MPHDDDFPPPRQAVAEPRPDASQHARDDFEVWSDQQSTAHHAHIVKTTLDHLDALATHDADAVSWACYDWIQINKAGLPVVPVLENGIRDEARFWAETASSPELECYSLAAMDKLGSANPMFTSRQIKRLVGALWRRMAPSEQAAFRTWVNKQGDTDERG